MRVTLLLAAGGASSSLQQREDTIWSVIQNYVNHYYSTRAGLDDKRRAYLKYVEINSAGASRELMFQAINDLRPHNLIYIGKSWGGYEGTLLLDRLYKERIAFDRLFVGFTDAHGPKWKLRWGWGQAPSVSPKWRTLARTSLFECIYQFNRKPFGTKFNGCDVIHDMNGKPLVAYKRRTMRSDPDGTDAGRQDAPLVDHFNIAHSIQFHQMVIDAIEFAHCGCMVTHGGPSAEMGGISDPITARLPSLYLDNQA